MPKKYDGPIDRHTDFTHAGPNGEPASGLAVQTYIKKIDSDKVGVGFTLEDGTAHLFFTDEEDMNAYIADPTRTDLIKDRIELEPLYSMSISLSTPTFVPVFLGSTGNYLRYTFATLNKSGQEVSEPVTVTYLITRGSNSQTITESYRAGTSVAFNLDKYLLEGANTITITVKGQLTKVSTSVGVTYQVINLSLSDSFDISTVHVLSVSGTTAEVPYSVQGAGQKIMEWYLDGEQLPYVQAEDEITESSSERTKYITLDGLTQGVHSLQFRVGIQVSGETFYSPTLYREVIVSASDATGPAVVAVAADFPVGTLLDEDDPLVIFPVQYVTYNLRIAVWNPDGTFKNTAVVSVGGTQMASVVCTEGEESTAPLTFATSGAKAISIAVAGITRSIDALVSETTMDIHEITSGLALSFSADGRTNDSSNRSSWNDGTHAATFTGFKWTETSGWVDGNLLIPSGANLAIDYAPLAGAPTSLGKTIEMELSSVNVDDDSAVLMNLMTNNIGVKLTATEIQVSGGGGTNLSRQYKPDENLRLSIVINRRTGATNKGLVFVYFNGILSIAAAYNNADTFASSANISIGGTNAGIRLKQLRIYDTALASDAVLNNYILYRDTISEMAALYDKNDLYESGTTNFDLNKIAAYLPVMVITGNIPAIENTTDKNLQIIADVEYTNLQNPSRSFKIKNAAIRGQGTSSMTYPKKNYRVYTRKTDATILYDAEGNVVADRLYAFKEGAQPVDCWCLKTDFAESSGTHNTGVARLWNDVMTRAQVNSEYVLRTNAQKAAIAAGYEYDVRTTVDGFPIVVFYHLTEEDDLIFLGKFNFNNDKSTESVFGFKDIYVDGTKVFDASNVQCFECLDSGNQLALFQTVEGFDSGWDQAWESRYPDTTTPNLVPLKTLATWISSTAGADPNAEEGTAAKLAFDKWQSEKANHFDLPKLAAYYVYLMRFGGVDQTVKNSMLTTEDGVHWFFINYDNDTIFGVRNDGLLRYGPTIDRQTPDTEIGGFAYAGHDSVLWNNFEADTECMELVYTIDSALYTAGLTYEEVIKMFNTLQEGKWAESIYNQDAQYKYIGPYVYQGLSTHLSKAQGARTDHRKWWISNRFALYDALYVNGAYTGDSITMLLPGAPQGTEFSFVSGKDFYYGYGGNNRVYVAGQYVVAGASKTIALTESLTIGTPINIFAPYYMQSLDLSGFISYMGAANFNLSKAYNEVLGSKMKALIMGVSDPSTDDRRNNALSDISSINDIITLETLNIAGYAAVTTANLSKLVNLKTFKAKASGLTSCTFAQGAPLTAIEMPATLQSLTLRDLADLQTSGITLEAGGEKITTIDIRNCPAISSSPTLLLNWLDDKLADNADCSVYMDNVNWMNMDPEDLLAIGQIKADGGSLTLRGTCNLTSTTQEIAQQIMEIFGASAFQPGAEFYITAPDAVYVTGPAVVLEGETAQYVAAVFTQHRGTIQWSIASGSRTGVSINADTGLLTTVENGNSSANLTIRCIHRPTEGATSYADLAIQVKQRTYPSSSQVSIGGSPQLTQGTQEYPIEFSVSGIDGDMTAEWSLTGDITSFATIQSYNNSKCILAKINTPTQPSVTGTLTLVLKKTYNSSTIGTFTKTIAMVNENVAISAAVNPYAMALMYSKGFAASPDYMTKAEAASVTDIDIQPGSSSSTSIFYADSGFRNNVTNFDEFQYFTGLTSVPVYCFYDCRVLKSIVLPPQITSIAERAFLLSTNSQSAHYGLTNINIPTGVTSIGDYAFMYQGVSSVSLPNSLTTIGNSAFNGCYWLGEITIPSGVASIGSSAFANVGGYADTHKVTYNAVNCTLSGYSAPFPGTITEAVIGDGVINIPNNLFSSTKITSINIPSSVLSIGSSAFASTKLVSVSIPNSVTTIGSGAFGGCTDLTDISIGAGVNSIGGNPVQGDLSLTSITVAAGNTSYHDGGGNCIIQTSNNTLIAGCKNTTIPNSVTAIGNSAFQGCTGLTSITIPNGVTSIGNYAFSGSGLTSITIPNSVTSTGERVCESCTALTSITLSNNLTLLQTSFFGGCTALTSVTIPSTLTNLVQTCFMDCTNLASVTLQEGLTKIGNSVFRNTGITSINIPASVTSIGTYAFMDCLSLTSISVASGNTKYYDGGGNCIVETSTNLLKVGCRNTIIPNTVVKIDMYAFVRQAALTSITIPDSVTYIDQYAFQYCSNLQTVSISTNSNLNFISWSAFAGTALTSFTIPASLGNLAQSVFSNCNALATITSYATTPPTIQASTLPGTSIVQNIYVPSGSVSDYQSASNWSSYSSKISAITT